jgi:hypothetical protein
MLLLGSGAKSLTSIPPCPAPFAQLLSDEVFQRYSVPMTKRNSTPSPPDVRAGRAHLYRTVIRNGAREGPNFADHYTIIEFGCGAATACLAISDATTGKVYFPNEVSSIEALFVDTGSLDIKSLNYRRNSRLLVGIGSPNGRIRRAGVGYYVWRSGRLTLIHFTPAAKLCGINRSESVQFKAPNLKSAVEGPWRRFGSPSIIASRRHLLLPRRLSETPAAPPPRSTSDRALAGALARQADRAGFPLPLRAALDGRRTCG